ncbi:FAD-dependent oxidoreductase [Pontibacter sp. JAM-7]|uniref:FAD-dependent oxidoreductase n=1 Tax=Pontibacter sp. JAM-7 TaxID=3366581 RepID=UPI003AF93025
MNMQAVATSTSEPESICWDDAILVVGAGPVGFRFIQELRKRHIDTPVILFGNEPYQPYDRVRLSALLAGQDSADNLLLPLDDLEQDPGFRFVCAEIASIDRELKCVIDTEGTAYPYQKLVLATGSRAHVPHMDGVELDSVFTFRNMRDAERLKARTARCQDLVVVGGGLLGLEAARALQCNLINITLVQQAPRIMNQQLDDTAADLLQKRLESLGIRIVTGAGVSGVIGEGKAEGVALRNGEVIACDTVLISAGIRPNIELARKAWLSVGRGIRVDDHLCTSDRDIYAIGECAEHNEKIYGLVAPGFEQAAIAADHISAGTSRYLGSHSIARLKVVGVPVFSMGDVHDDQPNDPKQFVVWRGDNGDYRKLIMKGWRLVGAVSIGEWAEIPRLQELITHQRMIFPWQLISFRLRGFLWNPSTADNPLAWPESSVICNCKQVTRGQLTAAMEAGCCSVTALGEATGAATTCGSCKPLVQMMVGSAEKAQPDTDRNTLMVTGLSVLAAVLAFLMIPGLDVSQSVQAPLRLDLIWNDGLFKQISGFTLLGLTVLGLLMSLKKRSPLLGFGSFRFWRSLHTILALSCVLILFVHTGLHAGQHLNQWLLVNFLALSLLGVAVSVVIGLQYKLRPATGRRLRSIGFWGHLLLSWPLPVLLSFHVLSVYYF